MNSSGYMSLCYVSDLVGQYTGQLVFVSGCLQESCVHTNEAAGQRKCVDHRAVNDYEERKLVVAIRVCLGSQMRWPISLMYSVTCGSSTKFSAAPNLGHDRSPELRFGIFLDRVRHQQGCQYPADLPQPPPRRSDSQCQANAAIRPSADFRDEICSHEDTRSLCLKWHLAMVRLRPRRHSHCSELYSSSKDARAPICRKSRTDACRSSHKPLIIVANIHI